MYRFKFIKKLYSFCAGQRKRNINYFSKTLDLKLSERLIFGANKERKNHLRIRKGMVNGMKKKDFLIKVTTVDVLVVSVLIIAGLTVPAFQNLMTTMFYKPWIYGILCINLVIDLLLLILNKFNKAGSLIRNMAVWFFILKLFVLFMACFVSIVIGLAN